LGCLACHSSRSHPLWYSQQPFVSHLARPRLNPCCSLPVMYWRGLPPQNGHSNNSSERTNNGRAFVVSVVISSFPAIIGRSTLR
jgi:hypothetical protein